MEKGNCNAFAFGDKQVSHQNLLQRTPGTIKLYFVVILNFINCRPIRFRWYQGFLNGTDGHLAPQWAIRNVILSPQCPELCNGHGRCTVEGSCECDEGYQGEACETVKDFTLNPQNIHESFVQGKNPKWINVG